MTAHGGFLLLDKGGEFVAWAAHAEVATRRFRTVHDEAACVVRASEGALITSRSLRYVVPKPEEVREVRAKVERATRPPREPRPVRHAVERPIRAPRVPRVRAARGAPGRPRLDITGMVFGRLEALRDAGDGVGNGNRRWMCRCECGTELAVSSKSLRAGLTKSCGCLKRERAAELGRANRKPVAA